jgi:hypothetical protein
MVMSLAHMGDTDPCRNPAGPGCCKSARDQVKAARQVALLTTDSINPLVSRHYQDAAVSQQENLIAKMPIQSDFSVGEVVTLRKFDNVIWAIIGIVAAIVLLAPVVSDFRIEWRTFILIIITSAMMIAGSWFYYTRRYDLRLSSALGCTAQIMVFTALGAPLSYLAASAGFPLQDHLFDAADKALGFDWTTLLAWSNAHPTTFEALRAIYLSVGFQTTLVILCLAFAGRLAWLRGFILAVICAAVITITISAFLPAQGVWTHYGLTADTPLSIIPVSHTSWPVFHGLRDGTIRRLVADGAEGIITFPSLHSALAVILIAAMWPLLWLRWLVVPTNILMLVATPIDGSHYVVDVLAGIAIAVLSLMVSFMVWRLATVHSPSKLLKLLFPELGKAG